MLLLRFGKAKSAVHGSSWIPWRAQCRGVKSGTIVAGYAYTRRLTSKLQPTALASYVKNVQENIVHVPAHGWCYVSSSYSCKTR